ncbi:Methyltransferase small domain-containing protein [Halopseudomonas xinjiangensis]|uniref:Methyltransferase small domain-containing protein n=1 Tax=Halopseudomonas xinjiangensis TaxID=487184 RepID=A0A1H1W8Y2_9GAMM|nr:class I SAM-dependent methyltransferase [Halopseudomonas xinjiangensis]SDS92896.1 Methyltransferase small domain-containing protein [Halopseudomonas xinjiangensis]
MTTNKGLADLTPLEAAVPSESADADQALVELGRYLAATGYQHVAITPLSHAYNNQRAANGTARDLRDIFGWSRPFSSEAVTPFEFELMQAAGVLAPQGDLWRSKVRWSTLGSLLCVHSAYPTDAAEAVFFGPDTYRFAQLIDGYLERHAGGVRRAVDIGCGSGAGALLIAQACPAAEVIGVDINRQALHLTRVNAALGGLDNVAPVYSNLLQDVDGEFDLIVANPPYMLDPQQRAYRHGGGPLGAGLSLKIVDAALNRLAPGGTLLLYTGVAMTNGRDPFLQALQQRLSSLPCNWRYRELDPDVFGEELLKPIYDEVERIAVVALTLQV